MSRVVFLLEEPSMKELLDGLLPRLFPGWLEGEHFLCIKHEGKSDLDKSIPRKLRAWHPRTDRFVIVRDNDNVDCTALKRSLTRLCRNAGRPETMVRIVCQELEAWYLGDPDAIARAFPEAKLNTNRLIARYRDPDAIHKPSIVMEQIVPSFQKRSGARAMSTHLGTNNSSHSFQVFVQGVQRLRAMPAPAQG